MSKTKTNQKAESGSTDCSDAEWPNGRNEHNFETLEKRLRWQIGEIEGPSEFRFATQEKLLLDSTIIEPGSKVLIQWDGFVDHGYIFTLPGFEGNDCYMAGVIHVPSPRNIGGKGNLPPMWLTLDEALKLPMVKRIVI